MLRRSEWIGHDDLIPKSAHRRFVPLLIAFMMFGARVFAAPITVAKVGDASITQDADAAVWTIAAAGTTLTLRLGRGFDLQTIGLVTANAKQWIAASDADTVVTINGARMPLGRGTDGFVYESAVGVAQAAGVQLDASFVRRASGLRITRHYAVVSGSPAFEVWTTFQSLDDTPVNIGNLNALRLTIPAGTTRWLTGLQGDNADVEKDSAFSMQARPVSATSNLKLGSTGRSSETIVPWLLVDGSPDEFFAALLWSGAWSLNATPTPSGLVVDFSLASMQTTPGVSGVDGPHALFGIVRGGVAQATSAVRAYAAEGLRAGRPLIPLVTYNTWFAYGTRIDEASLEAEMDRVAKLGVDLFVVDAGWYAGAGRGGEFDFDAGLGSWQVDPARFPNGLKALTDYAHRLNMKFGIWVEPERVNLETVGQPGLADEQWLAKTGASTGSDHAALICLANAAGRAWVQQKLFEFIDAVQPDYLKWDNNLWVNCDRPGHDHGTTDGNFGQTNGFYQVLAALRARYPQLLVENVASGGNRLDLGMLRYSDVAWMDDRTAPSVHVRHNVEGLSQLFPPAYLLSFVTDSGPEPLHNSADLSMVFRSRMASVLGLCFRSETLADGDLTAIAREISMYKDIQADQGDAAALMLSAQARVSNGPSWDVIEESVPGGPTVVLAFQSDRAVKRYVIKPGGLRSTTAYEVRSADGGVLGSFRGSILASSGIEINATTTGAQLLVLTPK